MSSKRSTNLAIAEEEDTARTLSGWRSQKLTALKLKCNQYSLSEQGNKEEVIHRLMEHMEKLLLDSQDYASDGDTTDDPEERPDSHETDETVHYGDDFLDLESGTINDLEEDGSDNSRNNVATNENDEHHPAISNNDEDNNDNANGDFQPDQHQQQQQQHQQHQQQLQNSGQLSQAQNDDAATAVQLILQELRNVQSEVRSLSGKHSTLDKKVKQSLKKSALPPSPSHQQDTRKRKSSHRDQHKHDQPSKKRGKQASSHQRTHHSDNLTVTFANSTNTAQPTPSHSTTGTNNNQINTNPHNQPQYQFQPPGAQGPYVPYHASFVPTAPLPAPHLDGSTVATATASATTGMSNIQPSYVYDPWNAFQNPFVPPSIKENLLKRIENRQFVDFIDLLPENQMNSIDGACNTDDASFVVEKSSGCLKQKQDSAAKVTRVKVNTFHRWCTAWCNFSQAYLHFHPEEYHDLFMYHSNFVTLVCRFKYEACYNYDAAFRLSMANQKDLASKTCFWKSVNTELRDRYCSDNALSKCTYCKASGHYESSCSVKQKHKSETLPAQLAAALSTVQLVQQQQPSGSTAQYTSQAQAWRNNNNSSNNNNNSNSNNNNNNNNNSFRPPKNNNKSNGSSSVPASQKYCWRFDKNVYCAKPPCPFRHACQTCGSTAHGYYHCYQTTSTNFLPVSGP